MTAIKSTKIIETSVDYDVEKYNADALASAEKKLTSHLKTHKEVVNEFIKQYFFSNRDRLGKSIKDLETKRYTQEVKSAYSGMVVFFGWRLPEQTQLDNYDAFLTKTKKKNDDEKLEGVKAVLAALLKKSQKGKEDERQFYGIAYKAVLKASEKEESKK